MSETLTIGKLEDVQILVVDDDRMCVSPSRPRCSPRGRDRDCQ